jgi:hypothetical protein
LAGNSDHCAPLPRIQNTPYSTARVSCQGRPRLSSRRAGRKTGSTNSHCSSVSSQRPAMTVCRDALSNFSLAEISPRNVYEMGSKEVRPLAQSIKKRIFVTVVAVSALALMALTPLAYVFYWRSIHNIQPLSVTLSLKRGEYISPLFTTDLDESYQIDMYSLPPDRTALDLDWEIEDDRWAVIQKGAYRDRVFPGGNSVTLGEYRPRRGLRQRIVLRIHDKEGAVDAHPVLEISLPERMLTSGYEVPAAIVWAVLVAMFGVAALWVFLFRGYDLPFDSKE